MTPIHPTPDPAGDGAPLEWRDTITDEDLITAPDDPLHAEAYVGALLEDDG